MQTFSVYAKAGTFDYVRLLLIGSSNNPYAYYDLSNGTVGSVHSSAIDAEIESVGNGWYRCSLICNETVSQARIYPVIDDNDFTGTGSIYIQDAQLEQGLVATDYIETTTSAVYTGITDNVPRLDYDGDCPSLLLEPQRTNAIPNSEYLSGYQFARTNGTNNSATSPEGIDNAFKLYADTQTGAHYMRLNYTNTSDAVLSVFAKKGEETSFDIGNATGSQAVVFNLENGTITSETGGKGTIEDMGSDWYRCSYHRTAWADWQYISLIGNNIAYTGDGSSGIYLYGIQFEEGSFATSYIPTYGTSVTRNADICNNAGDSTVFNSEEGVLYGEINPVAIKDQSGYFGLLGTTSANRIIIGFPANSNDVTFFVISQGTTVANNSYDIGNMNQYIKVALKYKENDFALWINGSEVLTDDNGTPNVEISHLGFFGYTTTQPLFAKCKAVAYFNRALTDTELADLTT